MEINEIKIATLKKSVVETTAALKIINIGGN